MNAKSLIRKTRDGEALSRGEIRHLVEGAVRGDVPDYQLTAWMMAAFFRGLTDDESLELTQAMLESGDRLRFSGLPYPPADKHSTGGVGDKLSFLVGPLVAAAGVPVPMISGRSLGHTGGTLDKLESIPGFRTRLDAETFIRQVERIGLCIAGQTDRLAPADRIFYALRDAASIVESVPLITASILSKKAAAGVRALVLDVKVGAGAFMESIERARVLARALTSTGSRLGLRIHAHLTAMDRVLGRSAGNTLEIIEAVEALRGQSVPPDLRELALRLGASMCLLAGRVATEAEGERLLRQHWDRGDGYTVFLHMVDAQGGDPRTIENPRNLPSAARTMDVPSPRRGVVVGIEARAAGEWITEAGGGRLHLGDQVDPRVGLELLVAPGDEVGPRDPVIRLHLGESGPSGDLAERAAGWILFEDERPLSPLFLESVGPLPTPGESSD